MTRDYAAYCLSVSVVAACLLLWLLSLRYGIRRATVAAVLVTICSILASLIPFTIELGPLYPAKDWRHVDTLDSSPIGIEYRTDSGLFAKVGEREVQLSGAALACLSDGEVARLNSESLDHSLSSPKVETTTDPILELPLPPQQLAYQVSFDILYPPELEAQGAVSFGVSGNGEVWCSERLAYRGVRHVGQALGAGVSLGMASLMLFCGSWILTTAASMLILKHLRQRVIAS